MKNNQNEGNAAGHGMDEAFSSSTMSRRDAHNLPGATEWINRFVKALAMLCRAEPPRQLCVEWTLNKNDDLQQWVCANVGVYWATGIGTIEAAEHMADMPEEGVSHKLRPISPIGQDKNETEKLRQQVSELTTMVHQLVSELDKLVPNHPLAARTVTRLKNKELHNQEIAARMFILGAHTDQKYGQDPYYIHLDQVADIVRPYGEQAVVWAYLHDVHEDTRVPLNRIMDIFGSEIAEGVRILTDEEGETRAERKRKTYAKMAKVGFKFYRVLIVKVADRLANVRACIAPETASPKKLAMYRDEHLAFKEAVYREGLCDELWVELDHLLLQVTKC